MKIKIKKVYYCDFCKKKSLLRSLEKHEPHCTMNINRECRLCGRKEPLKDLVDRFSIPDVVKSSDIMDEVDGCPACSLAIIRIAKLNKFLKNTDFDFKKELENWWNEKNKESAYEGIF